MKFAFLLVVVAMMGCGEDRSLKDIGLDISGPVDVKFHSTGEYFYVLNSAFDLTYKTGSLLVFNQAGEKLTSVELPRLAKGMVYSDDVLMVLFADIGGKENEVESGLGFYDLRGSLAASPQLIRLMTIGSEDDPCMPGEAVFDLGEPLFFIHCEQSKLFVGNSTQDLANATVKKIRSYSVPRQAMYLDQAKDALLLFPSDSARKSTSDLLDQDTKSFNLETRTLEDGSNEVPDSLEDSEFKVKNAGARRDRYRFAAISLNDLESSGFAFKENPDEEMRYLYFNLQQRDGSSDPGPATDQAAEYKYYRTHFVKTQPLATQGEFLISHRARPSTDAPYGSNILKFELAADFWNKWEQKSPSTELYSVARWYGFGDDRSRDQDFPGDFKFFTGPDSKEYLLINHFKDLVKFRRNPFFAWTLATVDPADPAATKVIGHRESTSKYQSFYRFAVSPSDSSQIVGVYYYANALSLWKVDPEQGLIEGWGDGTPKEIN